MSNGLKVARSLEGIDAERMRVLRGRRWSMRVDTRVVVVTAVLAVLCALIGLFSLTIGYSSLSLGDIVGALVGQGSDSNRQIVVDWRLPRMLLALLGGAGLGVSGALFQTMTRNPLGSPDVIGLSAGAYSGALVALLVLDSSGIGTTTGALIGGLATGLAMYLLAFRRGVQGMRLVIVGVAIGAMLNAVNSYLLVTAGQEEAMSAAAWGAGSLNNADWDDVALMAASLVVLVPFTIRQLRPLQVLEMSDDVGAALGVRADGTRVALLVLGVGYVCVITALAGPISFVALAAPQVARRVTGASSVSLLGAALTGGLLLVASDVIARVVVAPDQLPVGVVTLCLGGGYLLWLLVQQARSGR